MTNVLLYLIVGILLWIVVEDNPDWGNDPKFTFERNFIYAVMLWPGLLLLLFFASFEEKK
jgi:hypothetical protein